MGVSSHTSCLIRVFYMFSRWEVIRSVVVTLMSVFLIHKLGNFCKSAGVLITNLWCRFILTPVFFPLCSWNISVLHSLYFGLSAVCTGLPLSKGLPTCCHWCSWADCSSDRVTSFWFKGKELGMAFGVTIGFSRLGSVLSFFITQNFEQAYCLQWTVGLPHGSRLNRATCSFTHETLICRYTAVCFCLWKCPHSRILGPDQD